MKILIVDDNDMNRKLLRTLLESEGHTITEAVDGLDAIDSLKKEIPEAVITDILMPRMDGYRFCMQLRANPLFQQIPVVVYTSTYTSPSDEKAALDAGADRYLKKPSPIVAIQNALNDARDKPGPRQASERSDISRFEVMTEYNQALVSKLEKFNSELQEANRSLEKEISERERMQAEIVENEKRFRSMLDNMAEGYQIVGFDWRYKYFNKAFIGHSRYSREELEKGTVQELYPGIEQTEIYKIYNKCFSERKVFSVENEFVFPDGSVGWFDLVFQPVPEGLSILSVDITQRKHAELEVQKLNRELEERVRERTEQLEIMRESEARFRQVVESIDEVFWMTDVKKRSMIYISPGFKKVWGRDVDSLYNNPLSWLDSIHPEDRERVSAAAETQVDGKYDLEYRIITPGGAMRWIHDRASPVLNESGEVIRVAGVAEDITDRKRVQEHLLRAQRLESIGTLAGGIAHDLNNVFTPIIMGAQMLREMATDSDAKNLAATIETSAERGADLIRQVLTFARGSTGKIASVSVSNIIHEINKIIIETFPPSIELATHIDSPLAEIQGDPTQIYQIIMNLCVNARDAMPSGGRLRLYAEQVFVDEAYANLHVGAVPGFYVVITVSDTGVGIAPEIRSQIFDPFFTTKEHGKGTGLGLSILSAIVKSHGGFVSVYSEPEKGSSFRVHIPVAAREEAKVNQVHLDIPVGSGEWILVIDDNDEIRKMTGATLEKNGYRVISARDGQEGVDLFAAQKDQIKAVITDLMMPGLDGYRVIEEIRKIDPNVCVLAVSGLDPVESESMKGIDFLEKPYSMDALRRAVAKVVKK